MGQDPLSAGQPRRPSASQRPGSSDGRFRYWAFVSYSHRDRKWGKWAHRSLETYRVPKRLVGKPSRDGETVPARVMPVFRDREEFATASDLSKEIREALALSRSLIVVCSPNAAASQWVNEEILTFKRLGRADRILALIVDGEPHAGDSGDAAARECFPEALRYEIGDDGQLGGAAKDPIAADVRPEGDGRSDAKLKLLAGVLQVPFDQIRQREEQRRRKRLMALTGASLSLVAVLSMLSIWAVMERGRAIENLEAAQRANYLNTIALAVDRIQSRHIGEARQFLESAPPQLREWEWGHLWLRSDQSLQTLRGHRTAVQAVAFTPDGSQVRSLDWDGSLRSWTADAGQELATLPGYGGSVLSLAFSPDGKQVISEGNPGHTLNLWKSESGELIRTLPGHDGLVLATAFSPNGTRIASAAADQTIKLWDARSGSELWSRRHESQIYSLAFAPEGSRLVSGDGDGALALWDAESGNVIARQPMHGAKVNAIAFSPDGMRQVSASADRTLRTVDLTTGNISTLSGHELGVTDAAFSLDGGRIVSASLDRTIRVWSSESGKLLLTLRGHDDAVHSAAFSPDGAQIVSASADLTVKLWDSTTTRETVSLPGVKARAFSPDETRLVLARDDHSLYLGDTTTGEITPLRGHVDTIESLVYSPDGGLIASASADGTVRLWDGKTGTALQVLRGHLDSVESVTFTPDGRRVLSGSGDGTLRLWDSATGKELLILRGHEKGVTSVAVSPDGRQIASGSWDYTIKLWDGENGEEQLTLRGHEAAVQSVAFGPDGERLASAGSDDPFADDTETVMIWSTRTGEVLMVLRGHSGDVNSIGFSPNGKRLVSGGEDQTVKLWDTRTGRELLTLRDPSAPTVAIGVPTGNSIATVAFDPGGYSISAVTWAREMTSWYSAVFEPGEGEGDR